MTQPPAPLTKPASTRLDSIDALRGWVMVLMALDHVRDYFSDFTGNPTDPASASFAIFFTRWITHFCAPTFVFLAGTGAFLYGQRGRSPSELSRFLWTRGLWLVVLELTVVHWGWTFQPTIHSFEGQVIWAIGISMILLAALVHLPLRLLLALAVLMIVGHNALDTVRFPSSDWRSAPWAVLHAGVFGSGPPLQLPGGLTFFPLYPLIPWVGVMAAGYAFGSVVQRPKAERIRWCVRAGIASIAAFVVIRFSNLYGDPNPWASQATFPRTILSFLNCAKYPPSLLYLLMTLGPMFLVLAAMESRSQAIPGSATDSNGATGGRTVAQWVPRWLIVFGRVPMFYYLLHLYLAHLSAGIAMAVFRGKEHAAWILQNGFWDDARPPGFGFPLWGVYLAWIAIVALLYPACRWYAGLKQRSRNPLLSYL